jgi:hypothetical protein
LVWAFYYYSIPEPHLSEHFWLVLVLHDLILIGVKIKMPILHIGKKVPKGWKEDGRASHLGKGIWVIPMKKEENKCDIIHKPSTHSTLLWEHFCKTHNCIFVTYKRDEIECNELRGKKCRKGGISK